MNELKQLLSWRLPAHERGIIINVEAAYLKFEIWDVVFGGEMPEIVDPFPGGEDVEYLENKFRSLVEALDLPVSVISVTRTSNLPPTTRYIEYVYELGGDKDELERLRDELALLREEALESSVNREPLIPQLIGVPELNG